MSSKLKRLLRGLYQRVLPADLVSVPRCRENNYWYEGITWEPTVRYALMDLLRSGDVAFDCGANIGGLTTTMSRLVGPRGVVCAFEASPRVIDSLQYNIVLQGCFNTTAYHRAIYSDSTSLVEMQFSSHHHQADRIVKSGKSDSRVLALALDDFVRETGLRPNLVKMDIEGAELAAVHGFAATLSEHRPHLILETDAGDPATFQFLRARGYECWDLANYFPVRAPAEFPPGGVIRNFVYVHTSKLNTVPYRAVMTRSDVAVVERSDFNSGDEEIVSKRWLDLTPGRYHFAMDFRSTPSDDTLSCGIETRSKTLMFYQANSHFLATSYRDWIIDIAIPQSTRIFFRFVEGKRNPNFELVGGRVTRLDDLSRRATADWN